jgi:3-hydroxyacyl-CoA dehydrogenase/enoyl-CoA hydratase/3-hydroxybutyryl-CoA epimerase
MREIRYLLDRKKNIASIEIDTTGPVNTIGETVIRELASATQRANKDGVRGMIIRSAKAKSFLDGANLVEITKDPSPLRLKHLLLMYHEALDALATSPFPVAAVLVEQTALGGGFELILWACDRIFATPGSKMGLPEVNVGLFPAAGGLETLKRVVGFETALDIVMGGKVLPAEFYAKSAVVDIYGPEEIFSEAEKWIDANPRILNRNYDPAWKGADSPSLDKCRNLILKARNIYTVCPQRPYYSAALAAMEQALDQAFRQSVENQVHHFTPLIVDANVKNKIDLFFTITTVAPKLVTIDDENAVSVDRVAVIGAGLMGQGIAQVCADNGLAVLLFDVDVPTARKAKQKIADSLESLVRKGRWPAERRDRLLKNIRPAADYARLANVPLVIESVFEDLELKQKILKNVQKFNPQAVFATNTSALPMADVSAKSRRPEQVVGMHYFSPVPRMPLLEVVRGPHTSPAALATAVASGRRQKKIGIVVGDGPGFYTSRTFGAYVLTGFCLAEAGLDPWEVDRIAVEAGFSQGPFDVYGTAGGRIIYHASRFLESRLPELFSVPETLSRLVAAGYVGAGAPCFYKGDGQPDESARRFVVVNTSLPSPSLEEAGEMLLLAMVNQAFLCLDEGVLQDYYTMDIGAVLGIGFPDCWHGPARYVSQKGVDATAIRLRQVFETYGLHCFKPAAEFGRLKACGVNRDLI